MFADFRGQGTSELEYDLQHRDVDCDPVSKPLQRVDTGVSRWVGVTHKSARRIAPKKKYRYPAWPTETYTQVEINAIVYRFGFRTIHDKLYVKKRQVLQQA